MALPPKAIFLRMKSVGDLSTALMLWPMHIISLSQIIKSARFRFEASSELAYVWQAKSSLYGKEITNVKFAVRPLRSS